MEITLYAILLLANIALMIGGLCLSVYDVACSFLRGWILHTIGYLILAIVSTTLLLWELSLLVDFFRYLEGVS